MRLLREPFVKKLKIALDLHGIEIPYPRMVLYNREELVSGKAILVWRGVWRMEQKNRITCTMLWK